MKRILIYRHPDCARCARAARLHRKLDWLGRVDDTTASPEGHAAVAKGAIIVQDLRTGCFHEGVEAVRLIFRQVPLYFPLLLLLRIPRLARTADADARGARSGTACDVDT